MNVVGTIVNAVVIGGVGVLLAWFMKDRFAAFDQRIDRLERRLDVMQASVDAVRSDVTQVALAVGAKPRASSS